MLDLAITKAWEFAEAFDVHVEPGMFVSDGFRMIWTVDREVRALNGLHADHVWLREVAADAGKEPFKCEICGAHLSAYVVVYKSPDGLYHQVGQDCSRYVESKLPKDAFKRLEIFKSIKTIDTRNGKRTILNAGEVPSWYWQLPKDQRPKFISTKPFEVHSRVRGRISRETTKKWFVTIWGESPDETLANYDAFLALKATVPAPQEQHGTGVSWSWDFKDEDTEIGEWTVTQYHGDGSKTVETGILSWDEAKKRINALAKVAYPTGTKLKMRGHDPLNPELGGRLYVAGR